jgi:hypothetical protein
VLALYLLLLVRFLSQEATPLFQELFNLSVVVSSQMFKMQILISVALMVIGHVFYLQNSAMHLLMLDPLPLALILW